MEAKIKPDRISLNIRTPKREGQKKGISFTDACYKSYENHWPGGNAVCYMNVKTIANKTTRSFIILYIGTLSRQITTTIAEVKTQKM